MAALAPAAAAVACSGFTTRWRAPTVGPQRPTTTTHGSSSSSSSSCRGERHSYYQVDRTRRRARPAAGTTCCCHARRHKVTLLTPAGDYAVEVGDDEYILDAAERAFPGAYLPSSCRSGGCSSCAGRVSSGQVEQSEQTFLDENQVRLGYVLTCVARPVSDAVIRTHQEEQLY